MGPSGPPEQYKTLSELEICSKLMPAFPQLTKVGGWGLQFRGLHVNSENLRLHFIKKCSILYRLHPLRAVTIGIRAKLMWSVPHCTIRVLTHTSSGYNSLLTVIFLISDAEYIDYI